MAKIILDWILRNAVFRIYTSAQPIGKRLGGHHIPGVIDSYLILDIRVATRILVLGYFETI